MTSLAGRLRSRIGPGFHSEEWSKGMLKLPALATWHLLCHLTLGWPLYKSESVLSRKTYLGQLGWGEPSAKACRQWPTGSTVKQRQLPTGCFAQPMSNAADRETSCRRRFVLNSR